MVREASKRSDQSAFDLTRLLEQASLIVVAVASIGVGALDFLGLLDGTFEKRLPPMSLVMLGLVAAYLALERRGTLSHIGMAVARVEEKLKTLEDSAGQTSAFLAGFTGDRFSELKLIYGIRGFNTRITASELRAGTDDVYNIWTDLLRDANSFQAFNYVSPDEVWGTAGWAFNAAHALQLARLRVGCSIKRIFVIDDMSEYHRMHNLMAAQSEIGIEVRWMLKADVSKRPSLVQYLRDIESWDFVVVDNELIYRVTLGAQRQMQGCSVTKSRDLQRKALHVFSEAFEGGMKVTK